MVFKNIYQAVTQFFAPPHCAYCKVFLSNPTIFCQHCLSQIQPIVSMKLPITSKRSISVYAVSQYQDPLKRLILAKSWSGHLASIQMAEIIWQKTVLPTLSHDLFIPIPLHWTRYAWRGYNQAEVIARRLCQLSGKPFTNLLLRKKRTQSQFLLSGKGRIKNLENAFYVNEHKMQIIKDKHIVLVDDLMTTGITLKSAAKLLYAYRPASISAVVTCRVI